MNAINKAAIVKDLVRCIKTGDNKKLKLKTIKWIKNNYPLTPFDAFPSRLDEAKTKSSKKIDLKTFYSWFDAFEFVNSEASVNYTRAWALNWIRNKSSRCQESKELYNERVEILNEVRNQIEVKFYNIKYSEWNRSHVKVKCFRRRYAMHALDIEHAIHLFFRYKSNCKVKVHHVKADKIRPYVEII